MNILVCNYSSQWLRGQELALLDLMKGLQQSKHRFVLWNNNKALSAEAQKLGIPTVTRDFSNYFTWGSRRFDPADYASLVFQGIKLIRQHKIDIIHSNGLGPCQWLLPASWCTGIPILAHLHTTYKKRNRLVMGGVWTDRLVGVSEACIKPFMSDGVPANRLKVIYNGIDADQLRRLAESCDWQPPQISSGVTPLLVIASLDKGKGIDVLLEACRHLGSLQNRFQLLVAGDGPDRIELENLSQGLPVTFLGELNRQQVLKLLATTGGLLVLPSRAEGFPISLLEAAIFAVPAIVTRVGGMPEFVKHGFNGFVIERDDARQLANFLTELINDQAKLSQLGINAKQRVAEFSIGAMAASFSEMYSGLKKPSIVSRVGGAPLRAWRWWQSNHE